MILLFRKAVKGTNEESKNLSRFDKVLEEVAAKGGIILPEKCFTRSLRPGENGGNGVRKVPGWPCYYYNIAWAVTVISLGEFEIIYFLLYFPQCLA